MKKKKCKKRIWSKSEGKYVNKKGSVTLFLIFIMTALSVTMLAAVFAPVGARLNAEFYKAGEQIMIDTNTSLQSINDSAVRNATTAVITDALAATQNNIDINANLYKYGWILILGITSLVLFLFTRQSVAYTGGFI